MPPAPRLRTACTRARSPLIGFGFLGRYSTQPVASRPKSAGQPQILPKLEPGGRAVVTVRQPGNAREVLKVKPFNMEHRARIDRAGQHITQEQDRHGGHGRDQPASCDTGRS